VPRTFVTVEWQVQDEIYAPGGGRNGSGLVRRLEQSARKKGVQILLRHEMKSIIREHACWYSSVKRGSNVGGSDVAGVAAGGDDAPFRGLDVHGAAGWRPAMPCTSRSRHARG